MIVLRTPEWEDIDFGADYVEPVYPSNTFLYIYVDEAGNFDFSPGGTKFFIMTCVTVCRPFPAHQRLLDVKYDQLQTGLNLEYFHASEDRQAVRDQVFEAIGQGMDAYRTYAVVIRKNKTNPVLREPEKLYPKAFGWLMKFVLPRRCDPSIGTIVVVTDELPEQRKRRAMEKAVKSALKPLVPPGTTYHLYHHQSRSDINLQIADYFSWAIYRKWESDDLRSHRLVESAIKAEGDLFARGDREYY